MLYIVKLELCNDDSPGGYEYIFELNGIFPGEYVEVTDRDLRCVYFYKNSMDQAIDLKNKLSDLPVKYSSLTVEIKEGKDLMNRWKDNFDTFFITDNFRIVPFWTMGQEKTVDQRSDTIFINTDLVFGLGNHDTTRFMAEFIESKTGCFKSFLDIGTGTGILSIIAGRCGAEEIYAIDIEQDAVDTAKSNFKANNCKVSMVDRYDISDFPSVKKFDFVCANLLTGILASNRDKLISLVSNGGFLSVTGISIENYGNFMDIFENHRLHILEVKKSSEWAAMLFKRL